MEWLILIDAEMVKQVLEGDRDAYRHLVSRYQNVVYGLAYHYLQNFEDARDVAQESFIQAYAQLGRLREPEKFGAWIRQITVNHCHMKRRQSQTTETLDVVTTTTNEVHQLETRLVVQQALNCLSEASRLTLTLYYFQSYSLQEIASFLDVPVTTIKSRLRNARARLQRELMLMMEETLSKESLPEDFSIRVMHNLEGSGSIHCLALSPDSCLLANDSAWIVDPGSATTFTVLSGEVQLWDIKSGQLLRSLRAVHNNTVESATFSPDSRLIACGTHQFADPLVRDEVKGEVYVWEVATGALQHVLEVPDSLICAVDFSPDGWLLASGSRSSHGEHEKETFYLSSDLQLWHARTGELLNSISLGKGSVWAVTFSPDSKTIAVGMGQTGEMVEKTGHRRWVDCDVRLWDVETGELLHQWARPNASAQSKIAFSPDGKVLASGNGREGNILIWDVISGALQQTLHGHTHKVFALAFSPDGKLLVSGGQDEKVRLWDVASGALIRTIDDHANSVHGVAFSTDGRTFASADLDGIVKVWTVK